MENNQQKEHSREEFYKRFTHNVRDQWDNDLSVLNKNISPDDLFRYMKSFAKQEVERALYNERYRLEMLIKFVAGKGKEPVWLAKILEGLQVMEYVEKVISEPKEGGKE